MKKYTLLFILLSLPIVVFSQGKFDLEKGILLDSLPNVRGNLFNYSSEYNKELYINYTILSPQFKNIEQKRAIIQEDGGFDLKLSQKIPFQKIIIHVGDYYKGFILANEDVEINIDLNEIVKKTDNFSNKAVTFTGTDGELNQFYNDYCDFKLDKKEDIRRAKFSTLMNRTSQTEYKIKLIREFYEELEKIDKQFTRKNNKEHSWVLENELASEMYGDLSFIFIGRVMSQDLWEECLAHSPLIVSELSNRYYSIMALKLWSHEEKEVRALSRIIFNADNDDPEEKKDVEKFLQEQDKKKAGLSYDGEFYEEGVKKYTQRYEEQVADARLELYISKLSKINPSKIGLIGIKGQPLEVPDRIKYLDSFVPIISDPWQKQLVENEFELFEEWVGNISEWMSKSLVAGTDPKLGRLITHMASGAGAWSSTAKAVPELLSQIRNYYKGKAVIIYIWDTSCRSCIQELTRAGLTYDKLIEQPIEMVTLALNKKDSQEKWQQTLLETFAKGEHIFLSKNLSSEVFEYFRLPPVPSYLYFDADGNFIPNKIFSIQNIDVKAILNTDG